ncbi:restriction endonuclease subunit S [[Clostridium] cellulosi]
MSKYKRYERYKDSGVDWIGEIPEHWEVKKIKYLANVINVKASDSYNNKTYIGLENIESKTGKLLIDDIDEQQVIEGTSNVFEKNDVLFGKLRPYLAKCLIADFSGRCTSELLVLRCKGILPKYMFFFMLSPKFIDVVNSSTYGTKMPRANWDFIGNLKIPLPSQEEQKGIIEYLSKKSNEIDALIEDKEKLIELLQEKRQAIITEAVTKGLNPNVRMKDSGIEWIGEIPEHWRLSKIKYESLINNKTLSESTDDDYEIDYIDISSVTSIGEIDGVQSLNFKDAPSRARRILYKGDTIVSTVRTYLKAIAFIENAQSNLICSTGFAVLTPLSKVVPKYLFYLMRSEKYVNEIVRRSVGVSYPAVNASDIGALECALPDRDEQMYIVEYLDNCTTQINQLVNDIQAQIQKLKEYRQSLISEAVTGKIDVRDYVVNN